MSGSVQLSVLGPLTVRHVGLNGDSSEVHLASANAQKLLALLALEQGPHPRPDVMDVLWPGEELADDKVNNSVRARLRVEITKARRALGPARRALRVDKNFDTIELRREPPLLIDVDEERAARRNRQFHDALRLHRGAVLQSWRDSWLDSHRELQRSVLQTLVREVWALNDSLIPSAVEWVLRNGGADFVANQGVVRQDLAELSRHTTRRIEAALTALAPPEPLLRPQVIDGPEDKGPHLLLSDQGPSVPVRTAAVEALAASASPSEVLHAALGVASGETSSTIRLAETVSPDTADLPVTSRVADICDALTKERNVILVGASAAGKSVSAGQATSHLVKFGWSAAYFDLGAGSARLSALVDSLLRAPRSYAGKHLVVLDNVQGNPGLAADALELLVELRRNEVRCQVLAVCWPSAQELAHQALPEAKTIPCNGYDVIGQIVTALGGEAVDDRTVTAIARLSQGDLLITRLAVRFMAVNGRLPNNGELAEAAFATRVTSRLEESELLALYEVAALGQFEISPTRAYVEASWSAALPRLIENQALRTDGDFITVGHRTLATLTAGYLAGVLATPRPAIKVAIEYLGAAADEQVLAMLQRLDLADLGSSSSHDQHGSVYLARAWQSARVLSHYVSRQSETDPTWGDNTASAVFAGETLARFDPARWQGIASFVRSRWHVSSTAALPQPLGDRPAERDDFDQIAERMADQDGRLARLPATWQAATEIDLDRMHRSWVLGLLLGFEASAPVVDASRGVALLDSARRSIDPEGFFYPSRVPWVTARVLLGMAAAGASVDNNPVARNACDWLLRPYPDGPCQFGVWESGTGSWNTAVMTTTMCVAALIRCGVPPSEPLLCAGVAYVAGETSEWRRPGRELDAADAVEMHLLTGGHWTEARADLLRLLDWARNREPWAQATVLASVSQDESSKVPFMASALIRIVWAIVRAELPVLLEGVAMDITRRLTDDPGGHHT